MKKNSSIYDDEIDLTALFKIIWDGKLKILLIVIISFLLGIVYNSKVPSNYLISLNLKKAKFNEFIKLNNLKKLLISIELNQPIIQNQKVQLDQPNLLNQLKSNHTSQSYLVNFINEINDYEEFLLSLKNINKIEVQEIELSNYAKLLEIVAPKKNEENYTINFKWDDPEEAKMILQNTLNLASKNLKKLTEQELLMSLEFKKKLFFNRDRAILDYLNEQSALAKELNITNNQINNLNFQSILNLNINSPDIAYYLRGYKAIDKEIELIKSRNYQNFKFIKQEIDSFIMENIKWSDYNIYLVNTKLLKNTKLILLASILLGLSFGLFYVLISNAIQSQTFSKKNR